MRNLKKILALVLAMAMVMSVTAFAGFTDEAKINDNYAEAVAVLNGMGIFQGYPDESFRPEGSITRAEVAAIMYRISTQDVEDDYAGLYAGIANFSDVAAADWFAGYVGYCANAGLVKGYPDGTFKPQGLVTGFEALAMILRAMGYDAENEFSGMLWTENVAKIATKAGIMDELNADEKLAKAADRELVAQMVFTALADANIVDYTLAYGYRETKDTLGTDFALKAVKGNNDWGRPYTGYEYNTGDEETIFNEVPAAVYSAAVEECQIASDLDEDKKFDMVVYTNGKDAKYKFDALSDDEWGLTGQTIEVYDGVLVIIDNYLGYVTAAKDATFDKAGHPKKDAYNEVSVWMDGYNKAEREDCYVEGNEYAKKTWVIVNYNEAEKFYEIACEAESFVGAQDKIWKNASKHTIEDETYLDACRFYMDEAGIDDAKYTWFLDPYGNLIGSLEIEATYNYAVLKDLIWIVGKPGYAEATLVYMDGTEETVEVVEADEIEVDVQDRAYTWYNDIELELDDDKNFKFGEVSSDTKYNDDYLGYALYKIEYNKDGSVNLHGAMDNETVVKYAQNANIDTHAAVILDGPGKLNVTTATEFLVREKEDGEFVYNVYDIDTLPELEDNAEIFYTVNDKGIATRVYVKNSSLEAEFGTHLFTTTKSYAKIAGESYTYEMDVLVDGVERTIATNKEIVEYLAANKNKLFHVEFERWADAKYYGYVTDIELVNELEDDDDMFGGCDYLLGDVTVTSSSLINGGVTYRYDADTVVYGKIDSVEDLDQDTADDYSIWVIADDDTRYARADVIYVGTKLSDNTAIVVTPAAEGATVEVKDAVHTITLPVGVEKAEYSVAPADKNATLGAYKLGSITIGDLEPNDTIISNATATVKVTSESGITAESTVKVANAADVFGWKVVKTTMDSKAGAQIEIAMVKNGEVVKMSDATNLVAKVVVYDEEGTVVYTTDNAGVSNTGDGTAVITPNPAHTLTAGAKYKAVVTISGSTTIPGANTVETGYVQAQTTADAE